MYQPYKMKFTIKSKCGKYVGNLITKDDGTSVCTVKLVDEDDSHWFFDWISNDPSGWPCSGKMDDPKKYGIYNQHGELIDMNDVLSPQLISYFDESSFGWTCYMDDMRAIVDDFDTMFKWLNSGIDQFNEVINN